MKSMDWKSIQGRSNEILSDGIFKLKNQPLKKSSEIISNNSGNYLISKEETSYYIGEGTVLEKRLKQQFSPNISIFYKTYLKSNPSSNMINILDFDIQTINTRIGRKEIEEFGIVNLKTKLNKFQLEKRDCFEIQNNGLWDKVQNNSDILLIQAENEILKHRFTNWSDCNVMAVPGIYIIKNITDELIYIGESTNIKERFLTHSGKTYFSALRRHIGTEILKYQLQERNGKNRYFSSEEDSEVTKYLKSCCAIFYPVFIGRYEIEEFLIKKYKPLLNRKGNK